MKKILPVIVIVISFAISSTAQNCVGGQIYTNEAFLYGRFEVAMRSAEGNGIVSSFFLYNFDVGCDWPEENNEIDIEMTGNNQNVQFTTHYPGPIYYTQAITPAFNPHDAIHLYAFEWEPGIVRWFIDGQLAYVQDQPFVDGLIHPMRIMMNLWAAEAVSWVGPWDPAIMPVQSEYDFVRYYDYTPGIGNTGTGNNYSLVWEDQFNTIDPVRWSLSNNNGFGGNYCTFRGTSVALNNGKLLLQIEEESPIVEMVPVTFSVNTNELNLLPTDDIYLNGSFNNWCGTCAPMAENNGVWSITVNLEPGTYEYIFTKNVWQENGGAPLGSSCDYYPCDEYTNYGLLVTNGSDPINLETYCWGTCLDCGASPLTYDVTFQVDMNNVTAPFTTPEVNGTFNNWCGGCAPMSDLNNDGIWELTIALEPGNYEYKFAYDSWSGQEILNEGSACTVTNFGFTNRFLSVATNTVLPVVCWADCNACELVVPTYNVTFRVDMNAVSDNFSTPELNGTFNGWCGSCAPMSDGDSDGIWEVTLALQSGFYEYKFSYDTWTGQETLTPGDPCTLTTGIFTNRVLTVTQNSVLPVVCWESCSACAGSVNVRFRVDMSNETVSPEGVHLAGSFQNWDPAATPMTHVGFGIYESTLAIASNSFHEFKYVNGNDWNEDESVPGICSNGMNRFFTTTEQNENLDVVCFNLCDVCAGCTDPMSLQFNPYAGSDNGSCITPLIIGCTYPLAINFNISANEDDGSCLFELASDCQADLNGDGIIGLVDLLGFIAAYGSTCP
jgi:hypothetical protein